MANRKIFTKLYDENRNIKTEIQEGLDKKYYLFAQQYKCSFGELFRYSFFHNIKEVETALKTNNNLFEVVQCKNPCKMYFDLEIEGENMTNEYFKDILHEFIAVLKQFLFDNKIIDEKMKTNTEDICVLDSCRSDKLSYHIIVTSLSFVNNRDHLIFTKYFLQTLETVDKFNWLKVLKDGTTEKRNICDCSVYKPNVESFQNFRSVNQSKIGSKHFLKAITKHNIQDSMLTITHKTHVVDVSSMMHVINETVEKARKQKIMKIRNNELGEEKTIHTTFVDDSKFVKSGKTLFSENNMSVDELKSLELYRQYLSLIPPQNDRNIWISIGMALRNCGTKEDYIAFSKLGSKYVTGECNNFEGFCKSGKLYNIHTLKKYAKLANPALFEQLTTFAFNRITNPLTDYQYRVSDKQYVSMEFNETDYLHNDIIVIQSNCGTGKTYAVFNHFKNISMKQNHKLLSIVNKISLADQHAQNAVEMGIKLSHYKYAKLEDNMVICINSLQKLKSLILSSDMYDYVVYMDEISTFLESFTQNQTLESKIKEIYYLFCLLISKCHKIICTDALINDQVFAQIENIRNDKMDRKLFLNNTFSRFKNVLAEQIANENDFMNLVYDECELYRNDTQRGFLFMCDSKKIVNSAYENCKAKLGKEYAHKFIKITSDDVFSLQNVQKQFYAKFVFCSPSITTGVDISFDHKQTVFQYISGNSILADNLFQQTTRTRNIDKLHFYYSKENENGAEPTLSFMNLESVKNFYLEYKQLTCDAINITFDREDGIQIIEDIYFDLYCYNQFMQGVYKSDVCKYYVEFLQGAKFQVKTIETVQNMNKDEKLEFHSLSETQKEEFYNEFCAYMLDDETEEMDPRFNVFQSRAVFLGIAGTTDCMFDTTDKVNNRIIDELKKYKSLITDDQEYRHHFNLHTLLLSDEVLNEKVQTKSKKQFEVDVLSNTAIKVKLLRELEKNCKIEFLNVTNFDKTSVTIPETLFKSINKAFRSTKKKPTNQKELQEYYVALLKHICPNLITSKQVRENSKKTKSKTDNRVRVYELNRSIIQFHTNLLKRCYKTTIYHPLSLEYF